MNKKNWRFRPWAAVLATLLALGGVSSLAAQNETGAGTEKMRLTADQAVDLALKNNLSLQAGTITL
ncbi:MAG: hypothetical protein LBT39_10505, partial [Treponema sp.]|nr:hypothetical protein [Treponema sp.]